MFTCRYKTTFLCFILSLSVTFSLGCSTYPSKNEPLVRSEFVLGTLVKISLYDHQSEEILDLAIDKLYELESTLSINKSNTLIDKINANAGISPIEVDADTFKLIDKALSYSTLTNGNFDITVGPIVKLWNIGFSDARTP